MKDVLSIIAYIIIGYLILIYIPTLGTKIDNKIGLQLNQYIFDTVDSGINQLSNIKDYMNDFIGTLSFTKNKAPEEYIFEK